MDSPSTVQGCSSNELYHAMQTDSGSTTEHSLLTNEEVEDDLWVILEDVDIEISENTSLLSDEVDSPERPPIDSVDQQEELGEDTMVSEVENYADQSLSWKYMNRIQDDILSLSSEISKAAIEHQSFHFDDLEDEETGHIRRIPYFDIYEVKARNRITEDVTTLVRGFYEDICDAERALIAIFVVFADLKKDRMLQESSISHLSYLKCSSLQCFDPFEMTQIKQRALLKDPSVSHFLLHKLYHFAANLRTIFQRLTENMKSRFYSAKEKHDKLIEARREERDNFNRLLEADDKQKLENSTMSDTADNGAKSSGDTTCDRPKCRKFKARRGSKPDNFEKMLDKITDKVLSMDIHSRKRKMEESHEEVGIVFDKSKKNKHTTTSKNPPSNNRNNHHNCHVWSREVSYADLQILVEERESEKNELEALLKGDPTCRTEYEEKKEALGYLKAIMDEVRTLSSRKIVMWYWSRDHSDSRQDIGPFVSEEDCMAHYNEYVNQIDILLAEKLAL